MIGTIFFTALAGMGGIFALLILMWPVFLFSDFISAINLRPQRLEILEQKVKKLEEKVEILDPFHPRNLPKLRNEK